jgi:hypothetical protein
MPDYLWIDDERPETGAFRVHENPSDDVVESATRFINADYVRSVLNDQRGSGFGSDDAGRDMAIDLALTILLLD